MQEQLLEYYQQRTQQTEQSFRDAIERINHLKISQEEHHQLKYELGRQDSEISALKQALVSCRQTSLLERRHIMKIMAENDEMRIQELKDRKKINFLLNFDDVDDQVTYFRDKLNKNYIRVGKSPNATDGSEPELVILQDELQELKLLNSSLENQLKDCQRNYDELCSDMTMQQSYNTKELQKAHDEIEKSRTEENDKIHTLRTLLSEQTRELVQLKRQHLHEGQHYIQDKTGMLSEIEELQTQLSQEQIRFAETKRMMEKKMRIRYEKQILSYEKQDMKKLVQISTLKKELDDTKTELTKKINYYKSKWVLAEDRFRKLAQRRGYDLEGFTSDIKLLKSRIQMLEKTMVKYNRIQDAELESIYATIQREERAGVLSDELSEIKEKLHELELQF